MKPGLRPKEWQQLQTGNRSYLATAVTSVTPLTGLSANVLAHLRDDWISYRDDFLTITIPAKDTCNEYKMISGDGLGNGIPMSEPRRRPCEVCRNEGQTSKFENLNSNPNRKTEREKVIIHHDLARPAVEFIEKVFRGHGRSELGVTSASVTRAARRVVEGDSEGYDYSRLKRTAPVIYAHYGLCSQDIAEVTAYAEGAIKQVVHRTGGVNFDNVSTVAFLRAVSKEEPMTVQDLMKSLDLTKTPVHNRLEDLEKEGKVTSQNRGHDGPAATWETVGDWADPFVCNCGYETYSLGGIRTHRVQYCSDE